MILEAQSSHKESQGDESLDVVQCERFLIQEARLLDEARFDEWLALFTSEATYWVPSEPDQSSPFDTVSLMYDDRRLLETRVRRLSSPRIYSQEPRSRTSRVVTNVSVEPSGSQPGSFVRSKFTIVEFRRGQQRLFAGSYFHHLVVLQNSIRIAAKRVDLVNCDAAMDGLVIPF